ncbi:Putative glyoxalase/Bleomycin resistance protein/Dihydroxybiphenyl dioxygenase [Septoria linicola]|uniref:Glyoxalase/Bleomycin resistance protein/Dihydroxybiphenyl dioxygenase n=1 Tax=Septoria linicola TaxID=215465 RepID=A0A9Q9B552_9PEZI|nr:putative glyoxalase/Bleomycin resistance protein/Dihydroxybiphenyl dioxygenase [Septoria linicola]USW57673.1 Putative glyoxalase/Bleomycin resistance protein/Dihydroxybiphenyl dioxygenase [Septoria linicola]
MSDYQGPTASSATPQRSASPPRPFLGSPNEICIVTPDLKKTLSEFMKTGIASSFKIFHFSPETVTEQTLNGQPVPFALDVAFASKPSDNGITWEVMQPIGEDPTLMKQFLDRNVVIVICGTLVTRTYLDLQHNRLMRQLNLERGKREGKEERKRLREERKSRASLLTGREA